MLQWHELEINSLYSRPNHPILLQCIPVCTVKLILWIRALHVCHATQEEEEICGGEDGLIHKDTGSDSCIFGFQGDALLEESVPKGCAGAEDSCCSCK